MLLIYVFVHFKLYNIADQMQYILTMVWGISPSNLSNFFSISLFVSRKGRRRTLNSKHHSLSLLPYVPNLRNRSDTQYSQAANLPGSEGILGSSHEWFEANMIIRNKKYDMGTPQQGKVCPSCAIHLSFRIVIVVLILVGTNSV